MLSKFDPKAKFHPQLYKHDPAHCIWGDCWRTCIATIVGLEPWQVPHFVIQPGNGAKQAVEWLQSNFSVSMEQAFINPEYSLPEALHYASNLVGWEYPFIFSGTSRVGTPHAVVVYGGKIVHDPSGNGLVGPVEAAAFGRYWEVEVIWDVADRSEAWKELVANSTGAIPKDLW